MNNNSKENQKFMDLNKAVSLIQEDARGGIVLFVGAGISYAAPSNSPTWKQLINEVLDSACGAYPILDVYRCALGTNLEKIRPELICQIFYSNLVDGFWGFLDVLQMGQPNLNHESIVEINRKYPLALILTTNFESYIENSFEQAEKPYRLHICSCSGRLPKNLANGKHRDTVPIVKIHGSLDERASILLTLRQTSRKLNDRLSVLIKVALENYPVLVVGYSGNDDDILPVFLEHLEQIEHLKNKSKVKRIYWALWNKEESLASDIRECLQRYSACSLIDTDGKDILRMVAGKDISTGTVEACTKERQVKFMNKWASASSESCWMNFFFELLFMMDYHDAEIIRNILKDLEVIIHNETNEFTIARALKNRAEALICLEEYDDALKSLADATSNYMRLGHHREVIECLSILITKIPFESKWKNNDPLIWIAHLSAKSFSPYDLSIYNYTSGIYYYKKNKEMLAESHLMKAVGYAKRCGDQLIQLHCMEEMMTLYDAIANKTRVGECSREAIRLKNRLGIASTGWLLYKEQIVKECELAARKDMRRLINGEVMLVVAIALFLGGIASLFIKPIDIRIVTFVTIFISSVFVKTWYAIKSHMYNKTNAGERSFFPNYHSIASKQR